MGKTDPRTPLMSPVFADLSGLPPLLVLVGEDELLFDDAKRIVDSAKCSGTNARLLVGERMQYDWPLTPPVARGESSGMERDAPLRGRTKPRRVKLRSRTETTLRRGDDGSSSPSCHPGSGAGQPIGIPRTTPFGPLPVTPE